VTQFPPWSSHSPVCTITAVSKDLVRSRLVFHMILVSPPYRTNWGCLLADSGTIRREVTRPVADALVCSYYVRCVSTQRFLADVSVNHSRTGAVKLLITRRTSQSSKLLRGTVRRTTACPAAQLGCDPAPLQRMTRPCASRTLLSSCLRGNAGSRCGNPGRRPSRRGPARPFVDRSYVPCAGQRYCAAISGALSTRPQRRRRRWPDSKK